MKVGKLPYGMEAEMVEEAILLDIMDTVRDWLAVLMENYKVQLECTLCAFIALPISHAHIHHSSIIRGKCSK